MKIIMPCLIVLIALGISLQYQPWLRESRPLSLQESNLDAVNALIGDLSFVEKYGILPDKEVDERLRISTHLEYVESLLQERENSHLSSDQRKARLRNIALLHEYRLNGIFPKNYDYPNQRKPCFIDKYGRICAVGYLIEKTANRRFAERINGRFQYQAIYEMKSAELDEWISQNGLSRDELAMIQPEYGYAKENDNDKISKEVETLGIALTGSSAILNSIHIGKQKRHLLTGSLGVLLGATSLFTGLSDKSNYSLLDVVLGTSSMAAGILNLSLGKKENKSLRYRESIPQKAEIGLGMIPIGNRFGVGLKMGWIF